MNRKIIKIDEDKCTGCGLCVNACAEGAIQLVNGKAKLVSEIYCDGLGACIGKCPYDAITLEEREAPAFDENAVKEHLSSIGRQKSASQNSHRFDQPSCPGLKIFDFSNRKKSKPQYATNIDSELTQWPIQLRLIPTHAPYWNGADILLAADCTAFAFGSFHQKFLAGKKLIIACPKLDDTDEYIKKLTTIVRDNDVKSITAIRMEVPCCSGIAHFATEARRLSGKDIPLKIIIIGIDGTIKSETEE